MICQRFETERFHLTADTSILRGILLPIASTESSASPGFPLCNSKTRQCESLTLLLQVQGILIFSRNDFYPPFQG